MVQGAGVPLEYIGRVTTEPMLKLGPIEATLEELRDAWENGLARSLGTVILPDV